MLKSTSLALFGVSLLASVADAQMVRVRVTAENLSPNQGTYLTPIWVALHDGTFDVYDDSVAASAELESMAEDGDPAALTTAFNTAAVGQESGVLGDEEIAPGAIVARDFLVDPTMATARYFSFVAMVIPSNDAFIGNADPMAIDIFDGGGMFIGTNAFVTGGDVRDAGTEVNDEDPANTAFFGQAAPNTGTTEGGVVDFHAGFMAKGSGGILDDPEFAEADFTEAGYPVVKFRFAVANAITDDTDATVTLNVGEVVPAITTKAKGNGTMNLVNNGTMITFKFKFNEKLKNVTAAALHFGAMGATGPVVVDLLGGETPKKGKFKKLSGEITAEDLTGPFAGMPLDALSGEISAGNVYVNISTTKNEDGEIRGQVAIVP